MTNENNRQLNDPDIGVIDTRIATEATSAPGSFSDGVYVDIDALFDTRLGTLAKIDPKLAEKNATPKHNQREADIFEGIGRDEFKVAYKARDLETLACSYPTNAFNMVTHFMTILIEQSIVRPDIKRVCLDINMWPYVLTPELEADFMACFRYRFPRVEKIKLINIAPANLSMARVKSAYKMMIKYEYAEWLEAIVDELRTCRGPEVFLYSPAIYHEQVPTQKDLEQMRKSVPPMHPFEATMFEVRPFVGLQLLDVEQFSLVKPIERKTT